MKKIIKIIENIENEGGVTAFVSAVVVFSVFIIAGAELALFINS